MSQHHLPPSALDDWVIAACQELGLDPQIAATPVILDLARDVAHEVLRPAAPVSAFLLGLAVAKSEDPDAALERGAEALSELAYRYAQDQQKG